LLRNYLREYYTAQDIPLPKDFFEAPLNEGRAVVLLDGMDEVAEKGLRQRVARLVEKFAVRYPRNRYVVTSREVGYEGAARIGAEFGLAQVRDFSPAEVRRFVRDWTQAVETTLAGRASPDILRLAREQAERLIQAIERNVRVSELAVNPLLLTVIALVHRYRAQLPERRSELYEEAVEVLLGRWDEAKGL
ncbi:MAG: signal transduction protein, partial [Deltaproteobacteria bacterium]|nr:signal transduction protein [Deltaproteobacteria bacterium]